MSDLNALYDSLTRIDNRIRAILSAAPQVVNKTPRSESLFAPQPAPLWVDNATHEPVNAEDIYQSPAPFQDYGMRAISMAGFDMVDSLLTRRYGVVQQIQNFKG